jgi:Flp pilus assembly protein TadG
MSFIPARVRSKRRPGSRERQRGVATIELALSLVVVLVPLVLGIMDYGYYFFVSSTAAEATRVAARATANTTATNCTTTAAGIAAGTTAATNYMSSIGLGGSSNLFVTITCGTTTTMPAQTPFWTVTVEVNFPPAIGFIKSLMKQSTRTSGWLVYSETVRVLGS